MDNLIFSLNATVPLFLVMLLGLIFKKTGIFTDSFIKTANSFVFKVALPVSLFYDLCETDFGAIWDTTFVVFCSTASLLSILAAILIGRLFEDQDLTGEFAQAAYRSNSALLGISFIENVYGSSGISGLMIASVLPVYNVAAVVILSLFRPGGGKLDRKLIIKTLKGVVTNPILISVISGLLWSVLGLPTPDIMIKTLHYVGNTASPLGLMAIGASFDLSKALGRLKPAITASVFKLLVWCAIFLPIAVMLGFRTDKLLAVLVMLGSPCAVSSFIMAKNMGHEGTLTSSATMITTLLSAFTLTGWLYILRVLGMV